MALYKNRQKASPLTAVEFSPVSEGNLTFFYVDSPTKKAGVKAWITSDEMGQKIIAETSVKGRPVLVTHGDKSKDEVMSLLADKGDKLELEVRKKPFPVWALRSAFSVVGQGLQLASALTFLEKDASAPGGYAKKGLDGQFATFALFNMAANVMNFTFGSQKTEDKHQLSYLKEQFNDQVYPHLSDGEPIDPKEKRAELHKDDIPPDGIKERSFKFLQRNSVSFGEIGLRYIAALGLVFPMMAREGGSIGWKGMASRVAEGEVSAAFTEGLSKSKLPLLAGTLYLIGKTSALFTKVPDPYDDTKKHTALDEFREKHLFKLGSAIETVAGSTIAYNAFTNRKIGFGKNPTPHTDYLGGIGGILFATGYVVRMFAKFGEKNVNLDEIQAHISDSLAKTPKEDLPQLIAESASTLTEHFKGTKQEMDFGQVYSQIMTDMYRYHHVSIDQLSNDKEEVVAQMNNLTNTKPEQLAAFHNKPRKEAPADEAREQAEPNAELNAEPAFADKVALRNKTTLTGVGPTDSHTDKALQKASEANLGLSV